MTKRRGMRKVRLSLHEGQVEYLIGLLEKQEVVNASIIRRSLEHDLLQHDLREDARERAKA